MRHVTCWAGCEHTADPDGEKPGRRIAVGVVVRTSDEHVTGPADGHTGGAEPPASSGPRATYRLLGDRTFGPFFVGNLVSNCGNWFQNLAAGIVVYQLTRSNTLVGLVSVVQFAATSLLSPWAGALGDRLDRRRLLMGAQIISLVGAAGLAVAVAVLGVDGLGGPLPVYAATLVIGLGYAVSVPLIQALVPQLVPPDDLEPAIALNSVTFNLARAVGPALAGLVIATAGAATAFGVNALTFVALFLALLVIRPRHVEHAPDADRSVRAGFDWVRADGRAVVLILATLAVGVASDPVNTLSPAIADSFGRGDAFVGALVSAFGGGAALTAFVITPLRRRVAAWRLSQVGLVVLGLGMAGLGLAPTTWAALGALGLAGVGFLLAVTTLNSALQRSVPEYLRARVMALWSVAFVGSRPLAAVLDGVVADAVSIPAATTLVALAPFAAALLLQRQPRRTPGARVT